MVKVSFYVRVRYNNACILKPLRWREGLACGLTTPQLLDKPEAYTIAHTNWKFAR